MRLSDHKWNVHWKYILLRVNAILGLVQLYTLIQCDIYYSSFPVVCTTTWFLSTVLGNCRDSERHGKPSCHTFQFQTLTGFFVKGEKSSLWNISNIVMINLLHRCLNLPLLITVCLYGLYQKPVLAVIVLALPLHMLFHGEVVSPWLWIRGPQFNPSCQCTVHPAVHLSLQMVDSWLLWETRETVVT